MTDLAEAPPAVPDQRERPRPAGWLAPLLVWTAWGGAVAVAAVWVWLCARRLPYSDDWYVVDVLVGDLPLSPGWLWSQYGEHRIVVPRLAVTQLVALGGGDFRSTVWLSLALLAGASAAGIVVMRTVRGRTSLADVFFPATLLAVGLSGLHFGFQVHFVSTGVAAIVILLVMVRCGLDAPAAALWSSFALLVLLLGEGGPGLSLLPALLVWFVVSAVRLRRTRPGHGAALLAAAALVVAGMGAYFIDYHQPSSYLARTPSRVLAMTGHVLTAPGGDRMTDVWPVSGIVAVLVLGSTAALLVAALRRAEPGERHRVVALLLFGVAMFLTAAAVGTGRGGMGWARGLEHHYGALLLPLSCWVYVAWVRFGGRARTAACAVLAAAAVLGYVVNGMDVRETGRLIASQSAAFERDLCAGLPSADLAAKYIQLLYFVDDETGRQVVTRGIETLRRHQVGPFAC